MAIELNDQAKGAPQDVPDFTPYTMSDERPAASRTSDVSGLNQIDLYDSALAQADPADAPPDFGDFLNGNLAEDGKTKLKEHYNTEETDAAVKAAVENKVPIMAHFGAEWCGPCQKMEKEVWPDMQKEFKGKAAFIGVDGDKIFDDKKPAAPENAAKMAKGVEDKGYPTIRLLEPYTDEKGKQQFKTIAESGATDKEGIREMFKKYDKYMQEKAKK
jgi:thiol-disulfide isomerase/thioredoxin